jgi:hypothetical protein
MALAMVGGGIQLHSPINTSASQQSAGSTTTISVSTFSQIN